ncbi:MAG: GNAT family N-acetyltransferase [Candidatus Sulfotelmatobacter sp.]
MTELRIEEDFVLSSIEDTELALELTQVAPHPVHKVSTYFFRMLLTPSGSEAGRINLRVGSIPHIELYAGHVGFAVHPVCRGNRYASRSLRLLLPLARELRLDPLWITCDPENLRSRRSCELAKAKFVATVSVPQNCIIHQTGHPQKCRYIMDIAGISS